MFPFLVSGLCHLTVSFFPRNLTAFSLFTWYVSTNQFTIIYPVWFTLVITWIYTHIFVENHILLKPGDVEPSSSPQPHPPILNSLTIHRYNTMWFLFTKQNYVQKWDKRLTKSARLTVEWSTRRNKNYFPLTHVSSLLG